MRAPFGECERILANVGAFRRTRAHFCKYGFIFGVGRWSPDRSLASLMRGALAGRLAAFWICFSNVAGNCYVSAQPGPCLGFGGGGQAWRLRVHKTRGARKKARALAARRYRAKQRACVWPDLVTPRRLRRAVVRLVAAVWRITQMPMMPLWCSPWLGICLYLCF